MTLAAAQQFIQRAARDSETVCRINAASDKTAIQGILTELELNFGPEEFELAYYHVLTWCRTHEQAEVVKEIKVWWDYLQFTLEHVKK
jgi:hypothetical protein